MLRYGEVRKVIDLRFGFLGSLAPTGMSYTEIAKARALHRATVISICLRYIKRRGRIPLNLHEKTKHHKKLTKGQIKWAVHHVTLKQQLTNSLAQRCKLIEEKFGVKISSSTLQRYYEQHKITYKRPKSPIATKQNPENLKVLRLEFFSQLE